MIGGNGLKSSLFKNTLYKVLLNVCNLLIPLLVGPHIAGLLEPNLYGMYNRVYAEFGMFLTFAGFGIYNYGVREISRIRNDKQKFNQVFTSLFLIGIIANVVVGAIYIIYFMLQTEGNSIEAWLYMVMLIQIIGNIFYIEFVNEAVENYGFIAKKTIIIRLLYFASIFLFVRDADDVIMYAIVVSLTVFANNIVSYLYIRKKLTFDFSNIQLSVHFIPLLVTLIYSNAEMLYTQLDKVMLGPYVNDIAVTEYTLATTVVGMLAIIPTSLLSVSIPRLSHYIGEHDSENYQSSLISVTASFMSVAIPMFIGVAVLAPEIMFLYTRDVYTYAYPVLIIASVSRLITCYFAISSNLVMYINAMERPLLCMSLLGGVLNLVLNFALVHLGGFTTESAAITTVIANLIETVLIVVYSKKRMDIKYNFFSKRIIGYYAIAILFIPIALVVKWLSFGYIVNIVLTVPACMLIYGIYLFVSKDPLLQLLCEKFHLPLLK